MILKDRLLKCRYVTNMKQNANICSMCGKIQNEDTGRYIKIMIRNRAEMTIQKDMLLKS